jgi:hypothetical protein
MTNEAIEPYLSKNKRLSVISSSDGKWGGDNTSAAVIADQKELSGFDCGDDFDCRQADGSGYLVFDSSTIGKPLVQGHWVYWTLRGQEPHSFVELLRWSLSSVLPQDTAPPVCKPGCTKQYTLPMPSRRRLLFSSMPEEDAFCTAPDTEDFGSFLVNEWYDQSLGFYVG